MEKKVKHQKQNIYYFFTTKLFNREGVDVDRRGQRRIKLFDVCVCVYTMSIEQSASLEWIESHKQSETLEEVGAEQPKILVFENDSIVPDG